MDDSASVGDKRSYIVDLLVILFGSSAWIAINGLWVQTPLLVTRLPEAWDLPSYIVILTQVANIGPLLYGLLKRFKVNISEKLSIHVIMALGFLCCILLSNFWSVTTIIAEKPRSLVLLMLTAFMAIVDCTSSVLYFPFITQFKPFYLRSLMIGEGLSGLIPSFAALIQGVGGNRSCKNITLSDGSTKIVEVSNEPLFSVESFFYFLAFLCALSWTCFFILTRIKRGKNEEILTNQLQSNPSQTNLIPTDGVPRQTMITLLVIQCFCCCLMNGVLPALSTYSTLAYGNVTHHWSTSLSVISGPIAVFLAFALQTEKSYEKPIYPLVSVGTCFAGYIIFLATSSPSPPLQYHWFGGTFAVFSWVIYHACFSYVKACIAGRLRQASFNGRKALFYYGVSTQVGSLIGSIVIFFVMNVAKPFKTYHPCA